MFLFLVDFFGSSRQAHLRLFSETTSLFFVVKWILSLREITRSA